MKTITHLKQILFFIFACAYFSVDAATTPASISHLGPTISVSVQRGADRLPIYWVNHLRKGDRLVVTTSEAQKTEKKWLVLLATITPISNQVSAQPFDLSEGVRQASINIETDDQIPVIVLAPQVRTMFGLHTSFSESASLISDAIRADPQRFIDLQKIDQINHAIDYLLHALDALTQNKKADQAVDAAKALAAKFGVRFVDPDCFKGSTVNTKCVAAAIVSSADLAVPSEDIWSTANPGASAVKLPTDFFVGMKLMTETTTYLANKYGDNYDFAPSLGQRIGASDEIQLFTNARFKNGDIKTAYVYVPSWFDGKAPLISIDSKLPACLTKKELQVTVKGNLPLLNYWHDWTMTLYEHGSDKILTQITAVDFNPDTAQFSVDSGAADLPLDGQILDATLRGKFGFSDASVGPFHVVLPVSANLTGQLNGLESLISGEPARLIIKGKNANACIEQLQVLRDGRTLADNSGTTTPTELALDLSTTEPGPVNLAIHQYGAPDQNLNVTIFKRRAHVQKIVHYDLETTLGIAGDNLERIESIQLNNHLTCHAKSTPDSAPAATSKIFDCPAEIALNSSFPEKVTIRHKESEPLAFDFPVTKMAARPHLMIDGANAVVTKLSATALQWNLGATDQFVSEDSGLTFLLHAFGGYKLSHGSYQLQLKFSDDPQTDTAPISVPLMADLSHNELRTRKPITFESAVLPSVVNPIWYRVQHQPSGLTGDWQALNRSVIYLPQLTSLSCSGNATLVHGSQLELIDWAGAPDAQEPAKTVVSQCDKDQCLEISEIFNANKLKVKLHWIDQRLFDVNFPQSPDCSATQ
ncbi:hypothetical protein AAKU58_000723 [Oxalobacteraceae bacterium GrIS 1.18]